MRRLFLFNDVTILGAAQKIEACVLKEYPDFDRLLNLNAFWRKKAAVEPCTDKQWFLIQKFRIGRGKSRDQVTKADAMNFIDKFFNK